MNGTTDFVDVRFLVDVAAGTPQVFGASGARFTGIFIRP
jgi:hypothetical protein